MHLVSAVCDAGNHMHTRSRQHLCLLWAIQVHVSRLKISYCSMLGSNEGGDAEHLLPSSRWHGTIDSAVLASMPFQALGVNCLLKFALDLERYKIQAQLTLMRHQLSKIRSLGRSCTHHNNIGSTVHESQAPPKLLVMECSMTQVFGN